MNKNQFKSNKLCYKVSFCENIQRQSDIIFGTLLEFAKAHHKSTPRGKSGHGLGLGELPNILGFPYNIYATAGASNFKFGSHLEFAKAHDNTTRRRKGRHGPALGVLPKIWGFP